MADFAWSPPKRYSYEAQLEAQHKTLFISIDDRVPLFGGGDLYPQPYVEVELDKEQQQQAGRLRLARFTFGARQTRQGGRGVAARP